MINVKRKLAIFAIIGVMSSGFVCLAETYKNNVVDVRVNNEAGNAVKVIIYTDRPYTDPVVVNKKANNKYVILMPETNSTLKSSPTVTNGAGTISNVAVNTQSVSGGKGYTKITITSERPINVVPRTQQIVGGARTTTPVAAQKQPTATAKPSTQAQKPDLQKQAQQKAEAQKRALAEKQKQDAIKKANLEKQKAESQKRTLAEKPKQVSKPQTTTKPVQKPAVQPTPTKQPIEILENEIKTGQYANIEQNKTDEILNKEIGENLAKTESEKIKNKTNSSDSAGVFKTVNELLKNYKQINIWKLLLLIGAVTLPILVIMVVLGLDKKTNKMIDETFKAEEDFDVDYTPIEDDAVIEESYTEQVIPQTAYNASAQETQQPTFNSFDEMLDKVETSETQSYTDPYKNIEENIQIPENEFEKSVPETILEPETDIVDSSIAEVESDFSDSDFVLENTQEDNIDTEPYNPDGFLSDFDGLNDKDFFDELTIQTMASNNADGLPPQTPADDVFSFMNEPTDKKDSLIEDTTISNPIVNKETGNVSNEKEPVYQTFKQGDDELTMLTEVKLNDNTGIYLVNYDNFSSLVGHINDNYFVIKKFDEFIKGNISIKEAEKIEGAKRYLVRVGKNKMVVEVSQNSMTKLLDL